MRALVCRDGNLTLDRTYPMPEPQAGEALIACPAFHLGRVFIPLTQLGKGCCI